MKKLAILVLLVACVTLGAAQTKMLLCDFEPRGAIDTSLVRITTQLLQDALNATYKFTVLLPASGAKIYTVTAGAESAKVYGAPEAMVGNLMQIGTKRFLSYQLVDAGSATVKLADRVEIPPVEEFPVLCERIANALVEMKPFQKTEDVEKMTQPEVESKFRNPRKPYSSVFLTAGYQFFPFGKARSFTSDNEQTYNLSRNLVSLNAAASFETRNLLTMLQLGLMRGVYDEKDLNFDLTVHNIFGAGDWAPIAGGGVGITRYSWIDKYATDPDRKNRHDDGLTLTGGIGLIGLRTYYFRIQAAVYGTYTFTNQWGGLPGVRAAFGVTTPTLGPDATVHLHPACVGGIVGGFFLTGLIIALTS